MFYVSDIYTTMPQSFESELQKRVYQTLVDLSVPFERVENDETLTMEDCIEIDKKLQMKTVKTLFLCNRQETNFYLFVMPGEKRFDCKKFSQELGISRVSFAKEELLNRKLGVQIGAATIFGVLLDSENEIQVVIDKDILKEEYYGCTDGTKTCYMKLKTSDVLNKVLPYTKHKEILIEM